MAGFKPLLFRAGNLLQPGMLRFGLLQNRDVGIGVLPKVSGSLDMLRGS
jgi:hypothetical protein